MEYSSAKKNEFSVSGTKVDEPEPLYRLEMSQKEKNMYSCIYMESRKAAVEPIFREEMETQTESMDLGTQRERRSRAE